MIVVFGQSSFAVGFNMNVCFRDVVVVDVVLGSQSAADTTRHEYVVRVGMRAGPSHFGQIFS